VNPAALAIIAATVWVVVYLGYILVAGMGAFWAFVWPEGQAVRRLRGVALVGIALIGLGTVAGAAVDLLSGEYSGTETAVGDSGTWLLLRLAALAGAGFFGAELLRHPVRGWRRVCIFVLIVVLTATLVIESTVVASPQVAAIAVTTGVYLLAMAAWLGGLVALAALLIPRNRPAGLDGVWTRFSWFTGLSVLAMAITGTAQHLVARETATSRSGLLLLIEVPVLLATLLLSRYAVAYGKRLAFR
jgi:copper transport protein